MEFLQKAVRCAAVTACILTFSACGSNGGILAPKAPDLNKQFEMSADVVCGEDNYSVTLARTSVGRWSMVINEPYELQGIELVFSAEKTSAKLDGAEIERLSQDFSKSSISAMITALENAVLDRNGTMGYLDGGYNVTSGDCILSFEQGSASPSSFDIPKEKISGKVNKFTVTGEIFKNGAEAVVIE